MYRRLARHLQYSRVSRVKIPRTDPIPRLQNAQLIIAMTLRHCESRFCVALNEIMSTISQLACHL